MSKDIGLTIRKVLWCRSYLVWLLFGDSIPICAFIFEIVFFLTLKCKTCIALSLGPCNNKGESLVYFLS